MRSGLPDPAAMARDLLSRARQSSKPVDLSAIVELWPGVKISTESLDGPGYLVDLGEHGAEILVRMEDPEARQRYTIAHELGHWLLRLDKCGDDLAQCVGADTDNSVERWCERFAAELLIPNDWIKADFGSARIRSLIDRLLVLPREYLVSHEAMRRRVAEACSMGVLGVTTEHGFTKVTDKHIPMELAGTLFERTVEEVLDRLEQTYKSVAFRHHGTGFVSVHRMVSRRLADPAWVVCAYRDKTAGSFIQRTEAHHPPTTASLGHMRNRLCPKDTVM